MKKQKKHHVGQSLKTGNRTCASTWCYLLCFAVTESHTHRSVSKPGAGGRCPRTGGGAPNRSCPPVRDRYGALVIAGQRKRRSMADLIANTPADGMLCGLGSVNEAQFGRQAARVMVVACVSPSP